MAFRRQIYLLELNNEGSFDCPPGHLLQIEEGCSVAFRIKNGSKCSYRSTLISNYPGDDESSKFKMISPLSQATEINKMKDSILFLQENTDPNFKYTSFQKQETVLQDATFLVNLDLPGSFFFQIEFYDMDLNSYNYSLPTYIVIHPKLYLNSKNFPITSLRIQSLVSRCLGPLKRWEEFLASEVEKGYNAFHFLPIQKYGELSHYSISDQLDIDKCYLPEIQDREERVEIFESTMMELQSKLNFYGIVDLVFNHTSPHSYWLNDHPEAAFNTANMKYLEVAYQLELIVKQFSDDYANKRASQCPNAPYVNTESDIQSIIKQISLRIEISKLYEYFQIDYAKAETEALLYFKENIQTLESSPSEKLTEPEILEIILKNSVGHGESRYGVQINPIILCGSCYYKGIKEATLKERIKNSIYQVNSRWKDKALAFIDEAKINMYNEIKYEKIEQKDPKITLNKSLIKRYFTVLNNESKTVTAHSGWTMKNESYTSPSVFSYFRRSIVIWEDNIKLYYGEKPSDNPFIWEFMEKYTILMAKSFKGIRIDNAHSTPIPVVQYMIQKARNVNPKLIVIAELFSNDQKIDAQYINCSSINALIRESQYCKDSENLVKLVKKYGINAVSGINLEIIEKNDIYIGKYLDLNPSPPLSILFDITHDNPSPYDLWPNNTGAILPVISVIGMSNALVGTAKGIDDFFPKNPSVVNEFRLYECKKLNNNNNILDSAIISEEFESEKFNTRFEYQSPNAKRVNLAISSNNWKPDIDLAKEAENKWIVELPLPVGTYEYKFVVDGEWKCDPSKPTKSDANKNINNIITIGNIYSVNKESLFIYNDLGRFRKILYKIHQICSEDNYRLDIYNIEDVIVLTRMSQDLNEKSHGFALISRVGFYENKASSLPIIKLPGNIKKIICSANLKVDKSKMNQVLGTQGILKGLEGKLFMHMGNKGFSPFGEFNNNSIKINNIHSGFCILIKLEINQEINKATTVLKNSEFPSFELGGLSMSAINHLMFRCESEEKDDDQSKGIYKFEYNNNAIVPKYAGIASLFYEFSKIRDLFDKSHPIIENISRGNWLIDYHINRIKGFSDLNSISKWVSEIFLIVEKLPSDYKPLFFKTIIFELTYKIKEYIFITSNQKDFLKASEFVFSLIFACYQFVGQVKSSEFRNIKESFCAGLPFFSSGFFRCWGRDTFIAFRGILLLSNQIEYAKTVLKIYASVVRHGLIPNLLDGGNNCRYNCRDATWFYLQSVKDYIIHTKDKDILNLDIERIFHSDNQNDHNAKKSQPLRKQKLYEIIQEIIEKHAQGIHFTEWNAGPKIDRDMTPEGFKVDIDTDWETGFIYGGNIHNCGTWMDNMGSSDLAKNKGVPASPRDGSAIEIVGLLYSTLMFLNELSLTKDYPFDGVKINDSTYMKFFDWSNKIQSNFEKYFWIDPEESNWKDYTIDKTKVKFTGIYKDTYNSKTKRGDYMLRPNQTIAMSVAHDLFHPTHAKQALQNIEKHLITKNSIGIKTLAPGEPGYFPDYNNDEQSNNYYTAKGFCYHNGPEWVWPLGYFVRAVQIFNEYNSTEDRVFHTMKLLLNSRNHLFNDPWMSIPELTNSEGKFCHNSCPAQAWSVATLLEGLYETFNQVAPKNYI